jgi:protein ImuB
VIRCAPWVGDVTGSAAAVRATTVRATRVLAIWCMDWPAVAAAAAAGLPPTEPVAVTLANRVVACSAAARAAGVRRGLRRREAQARCPQLHVAAADPARDARHFEGVTAAVDEVVPRAEVLRPGLLVLSVRGAARYFGSEQGAAERLVDAVAAAGAECQVGVADQLATAVFAARAGRIVEPGEDAWFLAPLSIRQLAAEPSLADPHRDELADLLWRMGIRTVGQFAELSRTDVASRFGADAVAAHRFARGESSRGPSGREPPLDLDAVRMCDPPVERVDAAAFAGRSLAAELHRSLEAAGIGCTRLAIHAVTENGEELQRVWRCAEPLTEDATADRVRWQLDGWLNRRMQDRPTAPITMLRLHPVEVVSSSALQLPLWGSSGDEDRLRARRALVRVQGLLGPEAVRVPVLSGGRGPAERISFTPLGDEPVPRADPTQPWPGQLPDPSPTVLLDDPVEVLDVDGTPVRVTSRGMLSTDPACLRVADSPTPLVAALLPTAGADRGARVGTVSWWAGPWPVDERWWDGGHSSTRQVGPGRTARMQVLLEAPSEAGPGCAMLLCYRQRRWYLEGVYE